MGGAVGLRQREAGEAESAPAAPLPDQPAVPPVIEEPIVETPPADLQAPSANKPSDDKTKPVRHIPWLALIAIVAVLAIGAGLYVSRAPVTPQIQGMIDTDEIHVSLKTAGRVLHFAADDGDTVRRGQMLARMSTPEIASALAEVRRATAAEGLANSTLRRYDTLFKKGWLSGQRHDEAVSQAQSARAAVKSAQARANALIDGARTSDEGEVLDVVAPADGEIIAKIPNEGELVPAGYAIFTLMTPSNLWLSLNVREDQFNNLKIGQTIQATIPALNKQANFTVYYISVQGDFATWRATRQSSGFDVRTFEVRARPSTLLPNLRPGMSALVDVPSSP